MSNEVKQMYLLLRAWCDTMENSPANAFGYEPFAVTGSLEKAERMVAESPKITKKRYGWAAKDGEPTVKMQAVEWIEP